MIQKGNTLWGSWTSSPHVDTSFAMRISKIIFFHLIRWQNPIIRDIFGNLSRAGSITHRRIADLLQTQKPIAAGNPRKIESKHFLRILKFKKNRIFGRLYPYTHKRCISAANLRLLITFRESTYDHKQQIKNKNFGWNKKKSLAQEVRQKIDILDRRSKVRPLNRYFVCNTATGSLCDL